MTQPTPPSVIPSWRSDGGLTTGLLVSVRDAAEALVALSAGATVIDAKEPLNGPLGRPDEPEVARIVAAVDGRAPVTLACGELADWSGQRPVDGVAVAKLGVGPVGGSSETPSGWASAIRRAAAEIGRSTAFAAVAYADAPHGAPPPEEVLAATADSCGEWLVVDTFDKAGPGAVERLGMPRLRRLLTDARRRGLRTVVAGGVSLRQAGPVAALRPDLVGLRGAVCEGGREGRLRSGLVELAAQAVAGCPTLAKQAGECERTADRTAAPPVPSHRGSAHDAEV